jgi:hypothetical protein
MDAKRRKDDRRRCCECGRKFQAEPSAKGHQKSCSEACRLKLRARRSRERYRMSLAASREAARERQKKLRRQRREGPEPAREGLPSEVVRAIGVEMDGLAPDGWLARRQVELALRRVARRACSEPMSRAGLGAESTVAAGG